MDQYVGEIRMFAGDYAPEGWLLCDGQVLDISGNEVLFTVIGVTYGGNGTTTFALPDLRGRVVVHTGQSPVSGSSMFTVGQKGGTETVTLTPNQLPAHRHNAVATTNTATLDVPNNARWAANTSLDRYSTEEPNVAMNTNALGSVGGNQAHDNMMPALVINYIIALTGIYPAHS